MKQKLNVAISGLGIVGSGVYEILTKDIDLINKRSATKINLIAVSSRNKKDFVDESKIKFYANPLDLAVDQNIDVIVETIGGADGIAYELCKKSLKNKKHFVTANKAMIAAHGVELIKLAEENQVNLCFEASVAGSIPVLKTIKEGLAANHIKKIYAILNGTCNYILTKMTNADFADALKQAQKLGYAESDPTFDIEGIDTAHKIAILAAIAKNSAVTMDNMYIKGITKISLQDIKFAEEFGYKIKLLGIFEDLGDNKIKQAVYPCLISADQNLARVSDSYNAVLTLGSNSEWNLQVGRGAGSKPTASAIVADVVDIANNRASSPFGCKADQLSNIDIVDIKTRTGRYYLRFTINKDFAKENVKDQNFIKNIFGNKDLIEKAIVEEYGDDKIIYGLKTLDINEEEMLAHVNKIASTKQFDDINLIRIEEIS